MDLPTGSASSLSERVNLFHPVSVTIMNALIGGFDTASVVWDVNEMVSGK
jgi:hypothetical protein